MCVGYTTPAEVQSYERWAQEHHPAHFASLMRVREQEAYSQDAARARRRRGMPVIAGDCHYFYLAA